MARRIYKRDRIGRFARVAGSGAKPSIKKSSSKKAPTKAKASKKTAASGSRSERKAAKYGVSRKKATKDQRKARNKRAATRVLAGTAIVAAGVTAIQVDRKIHMNKLMRNNSRYDKTIELPGGVNVRTKTTISPIGVGINDRGKMRISHRPRLDFESKAFERRSGDLLGYRTGHVTNRGIAKFTDIYVAEPGRGKGLAMTMTNEARKAMSGRKVQVSAFRSDMGDAQAKKMFSPEEIPARFSPSATKTQKITENMDRFFPTMARQFDEENLREALVGRRISNRRGGW